MNTFNVLICHNKYQLSGGEDNVVESEMALLKSFGHSVELCQVDNDSLFKLKDKLKTALQIAYSSDSKKYVSSFIGRCRPRIVHVHNFFPRLTPSIFDACLEMGVPVVLTLHNYRTICPGALLMSKGRICEECITGSPYLAVFHRCYRNSFFGSLVVARMVSYHKKKQTWHKKVNRFIALTNFAKNKFVQAGFPEKRISVKPNFYEIEKKHKIKADNSRNGALFVGRLSTEKGIRTLLNAWVDLNIPLKIAGAGPLMDEIKDRASYLLDVILLGSLSAERVAQEMAQAAFLVMPSECYETFGMVLIESFGHGLAVVTSKLGSMAEIVENGITGLHFEPGNSKDLAEKVLWMYEHPQECQRMGVNAYKLYEKKYTPKKNYKMLMNIYKETIDDFFTLKKSEEVAKKF